MKTPDEIAVLQDNVRATFAALNEATRRLEAAWTANREAQERVDKARDASGQARLALVTAVEEP